GRPRAGGAARPVVRRGGRANRCPGGAVPAHVRGDGPGCDRVLDRRGVRPDPGADRRPPSVSELSVPLESIVPCLQGVLPSWFVTCSADGVPNATILSIVRYVDVERVALTRQFFNKTRANLDVNPQAQVIVVHPGSGDQFVLDLRYLHTESEGAI